VSKWKPLPATLQLVKNKILLRSPGERWRELPRALTLGWTSLKEFQVPVRFALTGMLLVIVVLAARRIEAQTPLQPGARAPLVELRGGLWFDGHGFVPGSRWMQGGAFVHRPRDHARGDSVVFLHGQWMVPPFGDAHTHSPDGPFGFATIRDMYLRLGVFYVQVLTNHRSGRRAVVAQVNVPTSIDVVYADGAITSTGGHPQVLYESLAAYHRFWQTDAERYAAGRSTSQDHDAYERLDSIAQLPALVARLARDTVAVLKFMLLNSDRWNAIAHDSTMVGLRGLDPALAKPLVAAAHAMGRRVWVHVETAGDFGVALAAGVDGFAHVPGYSAAGAEDSVLGRYLLSDSVIREAGRRGVLMTPTLALASSGIGAADTAKRRRYQAVAVRNARALRQAGVRMVVGSDTYSNPDLVANDPQATAAALGLSALEQLRLWAVDTPRAIFPGRRIAHLGPGYEASALALICDPLADPTCVKRISMRLKQGTWLDPARTPPAP
jgi:hypothetical protein